MDTLQDIKRHLSSYVGWCFERIAMFHPGIMIPEARSDMLQRSYLRQEVRYVSEARGREGRKNEMRQKDE